MRNWVGVFGRVELADIDGFDLVVAGGTSSAGVTYLSAAQVAALQDLSALVVAHLKLATVTPNPDGPVPTRWLLEATQAGTPPAPSDVAEDDGSVSFSLSTTMRFVDPRSEGWRQSVVDKARAVASQRYDGLYLDDLDVGQSWPDCRAALVSLVGELRTAVPRLLLIAQRGQGLPDDAPVDGYGHEEALLRTAARVTGPVRRHRPAHPRQPGSTQARPEIGDHRCRPELRGLLDSGPPEVPPDHRWQASGPPPKP